MPILVPIRYVARGQRLHRSRFLRCLPGFSPCKALKLFAQCTSYALQGAKPRLQKWADTEAEAVVMRHRLPARLRRHVSLTDSEGY